jgi:hypothetical protein
MAMSRSPRTVEVSVVTNSGLQVPIAITVSPRVASLISSDRATSIAPSTRSSASTSTSPIPATRASTRRRGLRDLWSSRTDADSLRLVQTMPAVNAAPPRHRMMPSTRLRLPPRASTHTANEQVRPHEQPCEPGHDQQGTRHGLMLRAIA